MAQIRLNTAFGEVELLRFPHRRKESLRAWDAADEYLLAQIRQLPELPDSGMVIVNDSFGALSVSLHYFQPINWSDSWLSQQACRKNLARNGFDSKAVIFINSLQLPAPGARLVLYKVPKSLALMEYQLLQLKPLLVDDALLLVAGMVRNMPGRVWDLLQQIIGPVQTDRAVKKARTLRVQPDFKLPLPANPYPVRWPLDNTGLTLISHANVFSREKLDIGTGFLLEHLPETEGKTDIIDLGCGNGVLGLVAAWKNPEAQVIFVDESWMAVESARLNCGQLDNSQSRYEFHWGDGVNDLVANSADFVLCNPPFHQSHSVGDKLALDMFKSSSRALRQGGELWIVGNRHLGYHVKLKRYFSDVALVASNPKFVVLRAIAG